MRYNFDSKFKLMAKRNLKKQIYEELSKISSALSSAYRLEILEVLAQGQHSVEGIARQTGLSIANASQHLQKMKNARLVISEKKGKQSFYTLANDQVYQLLESLMDLGIAQSADLDKLISEFKGHGGNLESIDAETLQQRLANKEVIVVDVRPEEEYQQGHIPGAKSIPLSELRSQLDNLPAEKEIVAYCRGSLCALADEATKILHEQGYHAKIFTKGWPEWRSKGLKVESNLE